MTPSQQNWLKRHPVLATLLGLIAIGIIASVSGGADTSFQRSNIYDTQNDIYNIQSSGTTPSPSPLLQTPTPTYKTPQPQSEIRYYENTAGNKVQSPTYYNSRPAGASARCGDGTYSFSQSRRGTCSHHGGVAQWY